MQVAKADSMRKGAPRWIQIARLALLFAAGGLTVGCHSVSGGKEFTASPLSTAEQQQAILKIAPLGTDREAALEQLKKSGIEVTPGASPSIYYCDVWNRSNGERWALGVALLFDASGKLYVMREADAKVEPAQGSAPAAEPALPEDPAASRNTGLRTPFLSPSK